TMRDVSAPELLHRPLPVRLPDDLLKLIGIGALLSVTGTLALTGELDPWIGRRAALSLAVVIAAPCAVAILAQLRFSGLLLWLPLGAIAYPFIRLPRAHPLLTFDRVWVGSMAVTAAVAIASGRRARSTG